MKKFRIMVAMSGGVDSSVAAAILSSEGHEVVGVTLRLVPPEISSDEGGRCCSIWDVEDARRVASQLGIPYYLFNLRGDFAKHVIEYFVSEYSKGRTPNPCVVCNDRIKFGSLFKKAKLLGFDFIATGHYARSVCDPRTGRMKLLRGVDRDKDQSYFLYRMNQDQLAMTIFPLGNLRKEEVKELAISFGLHVFRKRESQELCFVVGESHGDFVARMNPAAGKEGPILDEWGKVVGTHKGIAFYTIGQRKGLGISSPKPLYVKAIDPSRNAIFVCEEGGLYGKRFTVEDPSFISWDEPPKGFRAEVHIRYKSSGSMAFVSPLPGKGLMVELEKPQKAITPGQSVVFYDGDEVLGGGIIGSVEG